jgi:hypothetical protein
MTHSSGAVFDCFRTTNDSKVVKLTAPHTFDRMHVAGVDPAWGRTTPLCEAKVLSNQLFDLQGSVVPEFYGIYASVQPVPLHSRRMRANEMEVWAVVMQDAGDRVDIKTLTELDK